MGEDDPRSLLRVDRLGSFDRVVLDAPERRNALSLAMLDDLRTIVTTSAEDTSARGLVLDHSGPVFCAGVDLVERRSLPPRARNHSEALADLYRALSRYPKPVVCRVDGAARGGGLGLVVLADVAVATASASFAFTEVRVGVAPALVGAIAMAKHGAARLLPWLLSGSTFGPAEAMETGLVTELTADDGALALAAWTDAMRHGAPGALRQTKAIARRFERDVEQLIDEMLAVSAASFDSDEGREGVAAFAEKRHPAWLS